MLKQVLLKFEKKMEDSGPLRTIGKIPQVLLNTGVYRSLKICVFSHESVPSQRLPQLARLTSPPARRAQNSLHSDRGPHYGKSAVRALSPGASRIPQRDDCG